jgi:hypothetical protein
MVRPAAAIVLVLLVAGCGSASGERSGQSAATRTAATANCEPITTEGFSKSIPAVGTSLLTSVKVEGLPCSDRVVFGFRDNPGEPPGFYASYQPTSTAKLEDGSGRPIDVAGTAFIVVHLMNAATADVSGDKVTPTYTGPRRIPAEGTRFVREVVKTGDFESTVTWVIGLDEKRPFVAKSSGSQIVVDIG